MKQLIILLTILTMLCQSVFAASINTPTPEAGNENVILIEGDSDIAEGEKLTVTAFKHGEGFNTITTFGADTDKIDYVNVIYALENGKFLAKWTPRTSGYYDIYVSGSNSLLTSLSNVYIPSGLKTSYQIIEGGNKENIKTLVANDSKRKDIIANDEKYSQISSADGLAAAIYNLGQASADTTVTYDLVNSAVSLEILSEKNSLQGIKDFMTGLPKLGLNLTSQADITAYADDTILTDMAADMSGISALEFSKLDELFTERLVLSGVYKSQNWMDVLDFLNLISYPASESARQTAAKAITGTKYNSIALLKSGINAVLNPTTTPPTLGGGGGGGGGGGIRVDAGAEAPKTDMVVDIGEEKAEEHSDRMTEIFPDVNDSHYAFDDINYLRWHDIISGDDKGNFNPDNNITRAEIVKMLCKAFGIENATSTAFSDVSSDSWYAGYIGGAYNIQLVNGDNEGEFNPESQITREDLAVLIWRFSKYAGYEYKPNGLKFNDTNEISDYAKEAVDALHSEGIINGMSETEFAPKSNATRAQTAAMLARCLNVRS